LHKHSPIELLIILKLPESVRTNKLRSLSQKHKLRSAKEIKKDLEKVMKDTKKDEIWVTADIKSKKCVY